MARTPKWAKDWESGDDFDRDLYWQKSDLKGLHPAWVAALTALDKSGGVNKSALCRLLQRRTIQIPATVGALLADLLTRYTLTRPASKPKTPAYTVTDVEHRRQIALLTMRLFMQEEHLTAKAAAKKTVAEWPEPNFPINYKTLMNLHHGKHGAARPPKKKPRR
jgi:hypothetical protein